MIHVFIYLCEISNNAHDIVCEVTIKTKCVHFFEGGEQLNKKFFFDGGVIH